MDLAHRFRTGDAAGDSRDRPSNPPMPPTSLPPAARIRRAATHGSAVLAAALLLACAGRGAPPESVAAPASGPRSAVVRRPDTAPRMIAEGQPLHLTRVVPVPRGEVAPLSQPAQPDLWFVVIVEADGRPNLSTLQIGGNDGRRNREAIAQWLSTATFAPALLDGVPVAAEFRGPR